MDFFRDFVIIRLSTGKNGKADGGRGAAVSAGGKECFSNLQGSRCIAEIHKEE